MALKVRIPEQSDEVDLAIEVFSSNVRVGIVRMLRKGLSTRGEVADALGIAPNTISPNVKFLEDHGLVRTEWVAGKTGRPVVYRLEERAADRLQAVLWEYLNGEGE
ncbi:winged helix-turn-helix domain-containing protein [Rothia sp. HC945]|uniref:ArsR/SmtB family transcription factor n=1 Tax=Rothia sp. HC945 TaxID=3171170 RepID=UPI003F2853F1